MTQPIEIFTDGACKGNPGPGGWGALLRLGENEKSLYGGELNTTNNRMELLAAIRGLEALKRSAEVVITTDSQYVMKGICEWMPNWKKRGWKTASKQPVKNADLWQQLDELVSQHQVEWRWVRGHTGHRENEIADELANLGVQHVLNERKG
ncbi:ribonuclease HI [Pseudomonas neustonica]|jgi:ribonuclease HI|uniref:Ribonuclease H n=1 Tax=Pseudomonas neustonica TaxID=2487346 RepID=A0ABX9XIH0_9PSED|nr:MULTISPECIES: ribonuclease HI [Pseudomonas]MBA6418797.1 ribonuclease HI [Pseudomonas sp. 5Ae-yellow]ROZ83104.1 ribonuclease HI [Pseudomonas neustonica]ROZ86776.1 ribonuclease HI [Pseudomonas sp. SSM44]|tara:strand:- start:18 stop:470 length:453 start_codon:yes stop_codon:yes gene_type:complete